MLGDGFDLHTENQMFKYCCKSWNPEWLIRDRYIGEIYENRSSFMEMYPNIQKAFVHMKEERKKGPLKNMQTRVGWSQKEE